MLAGIVCAAVSAANLAPPFAEWKEGAAGGAAFRTQSDGRELLAVKGTGENSVVWRTGDLKLPAGGTFALRYRAKVDGSNGTIISGTEGINRDFGTPGTWTDCGFSFRVPDNAKQTPLRLGHWSVKGEVLFDKAELFPVHVAHRRHGDFLLGEGEKIDGNVYTDTHTLHWRGSTIHRTLFKQTATFNSNRWCCGDGSEVVYKHDLPCGMRSGFVRLNVNYHTAGSLVVSASKDGQNWTRVAEGPKVGGIEKSLPAELFPAKELYIRLQAEGKNANLQVDAYSFRAELAEGGATCVGKTTLLEERMMAAGLRVEATPSSAGVKLRWVNETSVERTLQVEAASPTAAPGARDGCGVTIPAKGEGFCIVRVGSIEQQFQLGRGIIEELGPGNRIIASFCLPSLPAGCHTVTLTAAENKTTACELLTDVTCTVITESAYGQRLGMGALGWWCESAWKVGAELGHPMGGMRPSRGVRIEAARGEYEAAQLVLNPGRRDGVLQKVEVGELRAKKGDAKIPASAISIMEVATVKVEHPSDYLGEPGEYPDPLPPLVTPLKLPANRNQALWILVHVPEDVPGGYYEGEIAITTDAGPGKVSLRVEVFDFVLPKESHLRSGFGLDTNEIKRYHKLKTKEQELEVYDLYMKSFAEHRIAPYSFYAHAPIQIKFEGQGAEKQVKIGWEAFDAAAQKYLDGMNLNAFMLQVQGLGGGTFHHRVEGSFGGAKVGTPEYERLIGDYLKQLETHLKEKGWLKKAYVYWFDEPDPKDYAFVVDVMKRMKQHAPGLCRMLTEQPEKDLLGHVDLWCGLTPEWKRETVAERRAAGEEVWWYVCCGPKAPYIGLFIEHPGVELRLWGWQSWQYGVQGILIWQTNYWTSGTAFPKTLQDPWQDPMSYVSGYGVPEGAKQFWGNGDGRFFYPPRRDPNQAGEPVIAPPISSLRWEALRDGVEDYEYFVLLKEAIEKARGKADAATLNEAQALLTVPAEISKDTTTFTKDVRPMLEHRRQIARMIERLGK
jgi:hypothetical protein